MVNKLTQSNAAYENKENLQLGIAQLRALLENMDGVLFQTEQNKEGELKVVYASNSLFTILKRDVTEVGENGKNVFDVVLQEDLKPLQDKIRACAKSGAPLNYTFRVCYSDGKTEWRHVHGVKLPDEPDGKTRMVHLVTNISNRKQAEEALLEKESIVEFAMRNTDINLWYFNCDTGECLQGENCQKAHEMPGEPLMDHFPECLIEMGYVREDSIDILRAAYDKLWKTGQNIEFDAWFRKADGSGWWCERDMLTAVTGPDGRVIRGIGIGKNVTSEKELELKFQSFQNYRRLSEKNTVASFRMNLTTGWLGDCISEDPEIKKSYSMNTVDAFFAVSRKHIAAVSDLVKCDAMFSRTHLLDAFAQGESFLSLEYRYRNSNRVIWLRTAVEMMKNPSTGDVEALLYTYDIDYEKCLSFMMDRLLDADYELIGLIDATTGRLMVFGQHKDSSSLARNGENYDEEVLRVFRELIAEEYYDEAVRTMAQSHIIRELENREYYTCSFPAKGMDVTCRGQKQWKFGYLDSSKAQILMTRTDITDLFSAEYDALTGLYNRQAFYRHAHETLKQNPVQKYLLIRSDIDRFKAYNDVCGTQSGDRILAEFGRTVRGCAWLNSVVCGRIEADHFCILTPKERFDVEHWNELQAEWLSHAVPGFHLTSSTGIYEVTDPDIDLSLMCDRALLALHTIKDDYINKISWYDERLREKLMAKQALTDAMDQALREEQFVIYFQPQVHYGDGSIVGAEALVRWKHPERGLIPPDEFIPLFEKNGFILKLDSFVWEKSCAYLRQIIDKREHSSQFYLAVNISRCDLYDPALCEKLHTLIDKYALPPSLLRLEITESAYMDNPDQLIGIVHELRRMGFTVEMDDFGTGYSSLTMLKDMPVDILKLDMKFLTRLGSDTRGMTILSAVIQLAGSLGLPVIAEGVETLEQADYLKSLGCLEMQGYYFGHPMPPEEFEHRFGDHF